MIPKIIHYCWFGRGDMPELAKMCIASWNKCMPDWEYKLWNEDNFDVTSVPYVKEAYEARKFAFVSDYVRLWALYNEGGLYFDTDVETFKSFDDLMIHKSFVGFEGSKRLPIGTCVIASEPEGAWVKEQMDYYSNRHFLLLDGSYDMTPNTAFITQKMVERGFVSNGIEQDYKDLHIFPVEFFCPRQTTGEYVRTANTYCDHKGLASWNDESVKGLKGFIIRFAGPQLKVIIIKLKRKIMG